MCMYVYTYGSREQNFKDELLNWFWVSGVGFLMWLKMQMTISLVIESTDLWHDMTLIWERVVKAENEIEVVCFDLGNREKRNNLEHWKNIF